MVNKASVKLPDLPKNEIDLDSIIRKTLESAPEEMQKDVSNYIIQQFNQESFKGYVKHGQLGILLENATDGLFKLIHMRYWDMDLEAKDPIFNAAFNLMTMLMTRIYEGKDYNKSLREIDAKVAFSIAKTSANTVT